MVAPTVTGCNAGSPLAPIDTNFQQSFDVSALSSDGTALMTSSRGADGFPILLVRQSTDTYVAISTQCTHEGCQVGSPRGGTITCPCHGAQYDLSGNVLGGPTNTPLYKYATTYDSATRMLTVMAV
jgi:Rieske Fe-S protein